MLDPDDIPAVDPNELLARYVFSRSHFSRESGRIKAGAFMPAPDGEISVTRRRYATSDELWQVGHDVARARGQTLYCRGDVLASTFASQNLNVKAAPIDGNPNHANVGGWPMENKARLKLIAEEIAVVAKFVPLPEAER